MDKQISLEEAAKLVEADCSLALGGMTLYRRPFAFTRQLLQRFKKHEQPCNLTLITFTASFESDLLVGAGLISKIRTCYFGLEIFGLAPMFTYRANRGEIEVIEESEASLSFGLRAQLAGVGFMPGLGWLGTDMLAVRPDVKTIIDPYSGEELVAFPAIQPDIAIIHALIADTAGNAIIGNNKAIDEELVGASQFVVITAEEIVPELERADIVAPYVDAVVHAPMGALPSSCHPHYPIDGKVIMDYIENVGDPASFQSFLGEYLQ
jgi:glutaconate CoA-transferase subunit A